MKLRIPRDIFDNPHPPRIFLCNTSKKIMGELPAYETTLDGKWNAYSELSFSIDRQYTDVLTGETKVHPLFDKAEGLRKVYVENIGYFIIQDPDEMYSDKDSKTLSCFSSEYETGAKYLENFRINTGETDSAEVMYLSTVYGENYTIDETYKLADKYDAWELYYIKEYTDKDSYTYERIQISDEDAYNTHFGIGTNAGIPLYIKTYPNVRFYWPSKPELSLLHLIFQKIPEWSIGDVDSSLIHKERKFDEDRIAVYDFLMNDMSETFKCVIEWDTVHNRVNFYEEAEDGITDDNTVQTRWDTDIFISRENLASEININYSVDDIKTKLKVSGADDLDIREVNLGNNYIMNLDYYLTPDWMEDDLLNAYNKYITACNKYNDLYNQSVQDRMAAYNRWNDLMNAVPADGGIIRVGDEFEKLYCIYTPIDTAFSPHTLSSSMSAVTELYTINNHSIPIDESSLSDGDTFIVQGWQLTYRASSGNFALTKNLCTNDRNEGSLMRTLIQKLRRYKVVEDTEKNKPDNILLRLRNNQSDEAVIRIYRKSETTSVTSIEFKIHVMINRSATGTSESPDEWDLTQWLKGELTAEKMRLEGFVVSAIGTMGAYFVLAKDETNPANLEDYGVNLLKEKQRVYMTIFQTQIEAMYSQEGNQCIVSDAEPSGKYSEGTVWFDSDSEKGNLYIYENGKWKEYDANTLNERENYARFIENYNKLQAVQSVLYQKEQEAVYIENGYKVSDMKINLDDYQYTEYDTWNDYILIGRTESLTTNMAQAARLHFKEHYSSDYLFIEIDQNYDEILPLYVFNIYNKINKSTSSFVVYLNNNTPYVSNNHSVGVYQAKMDGIKKLIDFENFFAEGDLMVRMSPFIREDEFSDSNFLLTGYESEEERREIYQELFDTAAKELKSISQPSLEFSMDMTNILTIPEFTPLLNQFQLGNFVRVSIRDGYIKRSRLLEVHLNFEDLSDFSCDFGNLVTTKSEVDKHADLLKQAVTAGKQVATSAGSWQRAVDKTNQIEKEIASGLQNAVIEIGKASGQSLIWNESGITGRKLVSGTTNQYEDEQFKLINNRFVFTNDGWKTSKAVFGKFTYKNTDRWGILADAIVGGSIEGSEISGGSLEIGGDGGTFRVNSDGSVEILASDSKEKYVSTTDMGSLKYYTRLTCNTSTVFSEPNSQCTITCRVYDTGEDITDNLPVGTKFIWYRNGSPTWNGSQHQSTKTSSNGATVNKLTVTNDDIEKNSQFSCEVQFDDSQLT